MRPFVCTMYHNVSHSYLASEDQDAETRVVIMFPTPASGHTQCAHNVRANYDFQTQVLFKHVSSLSPCAVPCRAVSLRPNNTKKKNENTPTANARYGIDCDFEAMDLNKVVSHSSLPLSTELIWWTHGLTDWMRSHRIPYHEHDHEWVSQFHSHYFEWVDAPRLRPTHDGDESWKLCWFGDDSRHKLNGFVCYLRAVCGSCSDLHI